MAQHFITKFTKRGGPAPEEELARILEQADNLPNREAWFGTRTPGPELKPPGICVLLAVAKRPGGRVELRQAVIAQIIARSKNMPDEPAVRELYAGHAGFKAWWHIRNPIAVQFGSLAEVPGRSTASGNGAAETFAGSTSFAYWDFEGKSFDELSASAVAGRPEMPPSDKQVVVTSQAPAPPPLLAHASGSARDRPTVALFGVDFSGGDEDDHGNRKIWVAEWSPNCDITLRCGHNAQPGQRIRRRDLPDLISEKPGWWSLDFPFGVAKETAAALGLDPNNWHGWLEWCIQGGDATERRDMARQATVAAGIEWALRRQVDIEHDTTWFPLFEQLYRQTIYGAKEVLHPLSHDERICILPWNLATLLERRNQLTAVVVEGFPGATIKDRILRRQGRISYKGATNAHLIERQNIVESLRAPPFCLPIPDNIAAIAVNDAEGDAVDALSLIVGSWIAIRLPTNEWQQHHNALNGDNALIEGWFPI